MIFYLLKGTDILYGPKLISCIFSFFAGLGRVAAASFFSDQYIA
jgi:hypothetical protein